GRADRRRQQQHDRRLSGRVLLMPADLIFDNLRKGVADSSITFTSDTIKCLLVLSNTWTPDPGDAFVSTILAAGAVEAAGTGDRQTLGTKSVNLDTLLHRAFWVAASISYPNVLAGTAYDALVVYKFITNDAASPVLGLYSLPNG